MTETTYCVHCLTGLHSTGDGIADRGLGQGLVKGVGINL